MDVLKKILEEFQNYEHEHLKHEHVHTSQDAAKIRGNTVEQAAKAIIMKAKKNGEYMYIQFILSGSKKVDTKKMKKELELKKLSLASAEEVLKITGCTVGSVPPMGHLFNLKTYMDEHLLELETIYFSAGTHHDSVKTKPELLKKIVNPEIISVS